MRNDVMSRNRERDVTLMLGLLSRQKKENDHEAGRNMDVARLFFDSFSKRVGTVEDSLKAMSTEIKNLRISVDRGRLSDLVLLERLQKAEGLVRESINWIKQAIESSGQVDERRVRKEESRNQASESSVAPVRIDAEEAVLSRRVVVPVRELGKEGPKSAPEIGLVVGRSREHTARLMKKLYEEGYVRRDQTRIPFRYSLVERVNQTFKKQETRDEEKEEILVPQT